MVRARPRAGMTPYQAISCHTNIPNLISADHRPSISAAMSIPSPTVPLLYEDSKSLRREADLYQRESDVLAREALNLRRAAELHECEMRLEQLELQLRGGRRSHITPPALPTTMARRRSWTQTQINGVVSSFSICSSNSMNLLMGWSR